VFDVTQRETGLVEHLACVVGERHLGVPLEVGRSHVGRIPSGALVPVPKQPHELRGRNLDLALEADDVLLQNASHLVELLLRPRVIPWADG